LVVVVEEAVVAAVEWRSDRYRTEEGAVGVGFLLTWWVGG
jgi:hypothetical protein